MSGRRVPCAYCDGALYNERDRFVGSLRYRGEVIEWET